MPLQISKPFRPYWFRRGFLLGGVIFDATRYAQFPSTSNVNQSFTSVLLICLAYIYALVLCGPNGTSIPLPKLKQALTLAACYIAEDSSDPGIQSIANKIDTCSPQVQVLGDNGEATGRDWNKDQTRATTAKWKNVKGELDGDQITLLLNLD